MSYEAYNSGATTFCGNPDAKWNTGTKLVPVVSYPELRSETVNAWMSSQVENEQSPNAKAYLEKALDPVRIGSFDGWRAVEVAQSAYHARMDAVFDCAVIESRITILK